MKRSGWPGSVTMNEINDQVYKKSKQKSGHYFDLVTRLGKQASQLDVERMLSLFEDVDDTRNTYFSRLQAEVRKLFHGVLMDNLFYRRKYLPQTISTSLLRLHNRYGKYLGESGETLGGVLTLNFDSVIDRAFVKVFDGVNYGIKVRYDGIRTSECVPLLKLHGSFTWKSIRQTICASLEFERKAYELNALWLRPSVFKKPDAEYKELWRMAATVLRNADVLRVVGSSLRSEDWALISLIFKAQIESKGNLGLELVIPEQDADAPDAIINRLNFLSKVRFVQEIYRGI